MTIKQTFLQRKESNAALLNAQGITDFIAWITQSLPFEALAQQPPPNGGNRRVCNVANLQKNLTACPPFRDVRLLPASNHA